MKTANIVSVLPDQNDSYVLVATIEIKDEQGLTVMTDAVSMATADEAFLRAYVEGCYLPNLKATYPRELADLELPGQAPVEEPAVESDGVIV